MAREKKKQRPKDRLSLDEGNIHRPKRRRHHIAQEYRETNRPELVEEMTRHLRPWAAQNAIGTVAARG